MTPADLESLRHKLGLSKVSFSKLIGVTDRAYRKWIEGKNKPSRLAMERIEQIRRDAK